MDRTPIKKFGKDRKARHYGPTFIGGSMMMINLGLEFFKNFKRLLELKIQYSKHQSSQEPRVVIFSDNIDEINGIAINSRILVSHLREQGHKIQLVGTAFHDKPGGFWEANGTLLLPARFSMEMLGYEDNEIAIPQMAEVLRYFKRYPIDIVELEVPGLGGWLVLLMCKFVGVKVISHYRTDVIGYSQLLVKSAFMKWYIKSFTRLFCKLTTPVIVPSEDFKNKMFQEMELKANQVIQLRRGINLEAFYPSLREKNKWSEYSTSQGKTRYLFVGRVSKEKELPFLESVWRDFRKSNNNAELCIVGNGPYLSELKENFADCPEVLFTGGLLGEDLASMYASADFFVFPSGTDTFGNVVVEALATGTPSLVTDSGGPRMIVEDKVSGFIIPWKDHKAWLKALEASHKLKQTNTTSYQKLRESAQQRSTNFSLKAAGEEWWGFYRELNSKS